MSDYSDELTSSDGHRYRITLSVAGSPAPTAAEDCPPVTGAATPSRAVVLTVANQAADRPAPFPPLRIEMAGAAGVAPEPVFVRDQGGACTFTPRVASIGPGQSVTFRGTSPVEGFGPGSRVEVNVSETRFTLAAPVG
ncbi:MAG: hypothetical protein AB1673_15260 [Actinomycetota bacterium]